RAYEAVVLDYVWGFWQYSTLADCADIPADAKVIGGGVAQAGETLFTPLRRHLRAFAVLDFVRDLKVRPAALARDAGLIGAAAAARQQFAERSGAAAPVVHETNA
ncbi:hypothetical protein ACWDVV_04240, partial [Streptomyces tendae]